MTLEDAPEEIKKSEPEIHSDEKQEIPQFPMNPFDGFFGGNGGNGDF